MTYSAVNVANNILKRSFDDAAPVSLMKLQKLMYFTASDYMKLTGRNLLDEPFLKWSYGPVLISLHNKFSVFEGELIPVYGKDALGGAYCAQERSDPDLKNVLDSVWDRGKNIPAVTLARFTVLSSSAWDKAKDVLSHDDIREDVSYYPVFGVHPNLVVA